jgi:hypothetical protein
MEEVQQRLDTNEHQRWEELRAIEHRSVDEESEYLERALQIDGGDPDRHAAAISQVSAGIAADGISYEPNRELNATLEYLDRDRLQRHCRRLNRLGLSSHGADPPSVPSLGRGLASLRETRRARWRWRQPADGSSH